MLKNMDLPQSGHTSINLAGLREVQKLNMCACYVSMCDGAGLACGLDRIEDDPIAVVLFCT